MAAAFLATRLMPASASTLLTPCWCRGTFAKELSHGMEIGSEAGRGLGMEMGCEALSTEEWVLDFGTSVWWRIRCEMKSGNGHEMVE